MFSFFTHASCANPESTDMPKVLAPCRLAIWETPQSSSVHTLEKAAGTKSRTMTSFPMKSARFTSSKPLLFFDLSVKVGAAVPTESAMGLLFLVERGRGWGRGWF